MEPFNFKPFPELQSKRLRLRRLTAQDENGIFQLRSDENHSKYLTRPLYKTMDEARAFIQKVDSLIENNESLYWVLCLKNNPLLMGAICLWNISWENERAEIGFEMLSGFQKKGYMQEAVNTLVDFAFNVIKFHSVEGIVNPQNQSSIKVLEKNHFIREAYFKENVFYNGSFQDTAVYSLLNLGPNFKD